MREISNSVKKEVKERIKYNDVNGVLTDKEIDNVLNTLKFEFQNEISREIYRKAIIKLEPIIKKKTNNLRNKRKLLSAEQRLAFAKGLKNASNNPSSVKTLPLNIVGEIQSAIKANPHVEILKRKEARINKMMNRNTDNDKIRNKIIEFIYYFRDKPIMKRDYNIDSALQKFRNKGFKINWNNNSITILSPTIYYECIDPPGARVRKTHNLNSNFIEDIPKGTIVKVKKEHILNNGKIRLQIEYPNKNENLRTGWVSLKKSNNTPIFRKIKKISNIKIKNNYFTSEGGRKRLIRTGPKGGKYYMKGGNKIYIK